jgi:hypothetical protein
LIDVDVMLDLGDKPEISIIDALAPLIAALRMMANTAPRALICHASEDKPVARLIAIALRTKGAVVWLVKGATKEIHCAQTIYSSSSLHDR